MKFLRIFPCNLTFSRKITDPYSFYIYFTFSKRWNSILNLDENATHVILMFFIAKFSQFSNRIGICISFFFFEEEGGRVFFRRQSFVYKCEQILCSFLQSTWNVHFENLHIFTQLKSIKVFDHIFFHSYFQHTKTINRTGHG